MLNEKIIQGLKSRLEDILKHYFTTQYSIEEGDSAIIGKGFGKDAITIDYKKSQIKYTIHDQFLTSFFKMNKLITTDQNISTKYFCRPVSQTISTLFDDYLDQPLAPLTDADLTSNTTIAINSDAIESISFDTFKLPVLDNKKNVKQQIFNVLIVSTQSRHYVFKIHEIVDTNIKSELSRALLAHFRTSDDMGGLLEQLTASQAGLEGMFGDLGVNPAGAEVGF